MLRKIYFNSILYLEPVLSRREKYDRNLDESKLYWGNYTMKNKQDFVIKNGVLSKYNGPGGDVAIPAGVTD